MFRRAISLAAGALALALSITATEARTANFNGALPPEPFLSRAIASIEAGNAPWILVPQRTINEWGCARGSLGCSADGGLGLFVMISEDADPAFRCMVLIHEEAHRLGWEGDHEGGTWIPANYSCPLESASRP